MRKTRKPFDFASFACSAVQNSAGLGIEGLFQFIDPFPEFGAQFGLDRAPDRRMFGLAFKMERAGSGSDFTLDFSQIARIHGKDHAGRRRVFRGIDHTRGRRFILEEEWAAEDNLATETASIASSTLIGFPSI